MADISTLVSRAKNIKNEAYGSPLYDLWVHDTKTYIEKNHGKEIRMVFDRTIRPASVFRPGDDMLAKRNENIDRSIQLMEDLTERNSEIDLSNSESATMLREVQRAVGQRLNIETINIQGDATFGSNSPLYKIQIDEVLTALLDEAEKLPDTEEKRSLIQNIKSTLENPTLASVAGGVLGGLVQALIPR